MPYNYNGGLTIHATTATGAIPIQDALIVIKGSDEENAHIELSLITDEDGVTDTVYLPAPELSYSLDKSANDIESIL
jgi:outer membrane usher protein FimD/PapC